MTSRAARSADVLRPAASWLCRLTAVLLLLLILLPSRSEAGTVNGYTFATPIASSFCSFTPSASTSLTTGCSAIPTGALCAYVTATGQNVNWRDDTSAATATVGTGGQELPADRNMWYCGVLSNLRFIQQSVSAVLSVSFYK